MSQQQQYRDPPPYPGHSKQVYNNQPGLRQSFSGSETSTDVSLSSTENLATWQRQDPQGEETQTPLYQHLDDGNYSILARLGMPPGTIDSKTIPDQHISTSSSQYYTTGSGSPSYYSSSAHSQTVYASSLSGREDTTNVYASGGIRQHLTVPQNWQAQGLPPPQSANYFRSVTPTYHHPHPYINAQWNSAEQGQNCQLFTYLANLPPPPEYPGQRLSNVEKKGLSQSDEHLVRKVDLTHSHPDLSHLSESKSCHSKPVVSVLLGSHTASEPIFTIARSGSSSSESQDKYENVVEMLTDENRRLREELTNYYKKVSKLQKFELEIQKVHEAYESLVKSSQKREQLEAALKTKLEEELKKVRMQNEELKAQLLWPAVSPQPADIKSLSGAMKRETESEAIVSKLQSQNQQLMSKENLESQVVALQQTAAQHKAQRDVLDAKLVAAQDNLARLEEEIRKKDAQVGRVEQLQRAFTSLQTSSERREEKEKQLRSRLEQELEVYKSQDKGSGFVGSDKATETLTNVATLKQLLSEKEKKILLLETDIVKWEQRYSEMQAAHQIAGSTSPQEARLAALEKSSAETEKLIDEAMTEKLRHMEELYQSNRRIAELEAKVKWLQTQLSEKEAMVKVYQRVPPTIPRSSSVHALCTSPLHSPRPSLIASTTLTRPSGSLGSTGISGSYCDFVTIRHVKTGSTSAIETGCKLSEENCCDHQDPDLVSKDSEDESKLWHV